MTYATDTDIRELKTAVEAIGRTTEAIDRRLEALTRTTEANAKAIEANTKAIADLTLEMRVGFGNVNGQITNAESKLEGKINTLDAKFDERSKGMGQRLDGKELAIRNVSTGLTVTIVGGILLSLGRFLFFGIGIKP